MVLLVVQRSEVHQLKLVVYPVIYEVLHVPGGGPWEFEKPSTVVKNGDLPWETRKNHQFNPFEIYARQIG